MMRLLMLNIMIAVIISSCDKSPALNYESKQTQATETVQPRFSAQDYMMWVESPEGLRISKRIEDIDFQLQYTPKEYMVLKENVDSLERLDEKKLIILSKMYDQLQYYRLRISIDNYNDEIVKYNIHNDVEYEERVKYYSFGMQHHIKLIDGKDTLPCVLFNYERTFNLTSSSNFQLAFPVGTGKSSKTFMMDDVYLGTGKIMLVLTEERMASIPKIVF